jgi:hypothetical protein
VPNYSACSRDRLVTAIFTSEQFLVADAHSDAPSRIIGTGERGTSVSLVVANDCHRAFYLSYGYVDRDWALTAHLHRISNFKALTERHSATFYVLLLQQ